MRLAWSETRYRKDGTGTKTLAARFDLTAADGRAKAKSLPTIPPAMHASAFALFYPSMSR